jgi:hypothetical protein
MNYPEMNTLFKTLVRQLQDIVPQVELARGKEACVMQETQDDDIVLKKIDETFIKVYKNLEMSMRSASQLFKICPHPLIDEIIHKLAELNYSPLPVVCEDMETKKASLQEGYVEEYINHNKDALVAINQLSKELSNVSPAFLVSQQLRNVIGKIGALGSRFAAHEYSKEDGFPGPFDMIRNSIGELLDVIKSAQEVCIHLSDDTTTVLIKLYHRVSDTKDLVSRNLFKGETPVQRLGSIQDNLSQAYKKIEIDYRDFLEESAVKFELGHIKLVGIAEAGQKNNYSNEGTTTPAESVTQSPKKPAEPGPAASSGEAGKTNKPKKKLKPQKKNRKTKLKIDEGGLTAWLNGKSHKITERQKNFLKELLNKKGEWVSGKKLRKDIDERVDKIKNSLPSPIKKLIKSHTRDGYRLVLK